MTEHWSTRFPSVVCRGCRRLIVWGIDAGGQRIPLDPRPAIYRTTVSKENPKRWKVSVVRDIDCMVSHFATCPKASAFSGTAKPSEPEERYL